MCRPNVPPRQGLVIDQLAVLAGKHAVLLRRRGRVGRRRLLGGGVLFGLLLGRRHVGGGLVIAHVRRVAHGCRRLGVGCLDAMRRVFSVGRPVSLSRPFFSLSTGSHTHKHTQTRLRVAGSRYGDEPDEARLRSGRMGELRCKWSGREREKEDSEEDWNHDVWGNRQKIPLIQTRI